MLRQDASLNECRYGTHLPTSHAAPLTHIEQAGDATVSVTFLKAGTFDWLRCDLDAATTIDQALDNSGHAIFTVPNIDECDLSLQSPLDSFVVNTNYFSSEFGRYGRMETIGHLGAQRVWAYVCWL